MNISIHQSIYHYSDSGIKASLPICNGHWPTSLPSCESPSDSHSSAGVHLHTDPAGTKCQGFSNCLHNLPNNQGSTVVNTGGSHHLALLLLQHRGAEHPHQPLEEVENDQKFGVRVSVKENFSCYSQLAWRGKCKYLCHLLKYLNYIFIFHLFTSFNLN